MMSSSLSERYCSQGEDIPIAGCRDVSTNKIANECFLFVREIKFTRRFLLLGGRGVEWLVKHNDYILFVREILLMRIIPLLGGGVY